MGAFLEEVRKGKHVHAYRQICLSNDWGILYSVITTAKECKMHRKLSDRQLGETHIFTVQAAPSTDH